MKKRWQWRTQDLVENLDLVLALAGAVVAGGSFLALLLLRQSVPALSRFAERPFPAIQIAALLIIPFIAYAVIRWRYLRRGQSPWENTSASHSIYLLLTIAFLALFSYSLLSIAFKAEPYVRPLGYFLSTAAALGLLSVEAFLLPGGKGYSAFLLCKMLAVLLGLRLTPQLLSPTVVGMDPWGNQKFITDILSLGHIPMGMPYSQLPGLPLGMAVTSLAGGLDYRLSAMMFMTVLQAASLVFVFLLMRHIFNEKAGLLAVLLLGIAEGYLRMGVWVIAMGVGMALWFPIIYLIFKAREQHSFPLTVLYLLLMGLLILTHPFASMVMALSLLLLWLGFLLYRWLYGGDAEVPAGLNVVLFFLVSMFAWWTYVSMTSLDSLARLIKWGFTFEALPSLRPIEAVSRYLATVPDIEKSLNRLGTDLLAALWIAGSLYLVSKRFGNRYSFAIATVAPVLFLVAEFSSPLGKAGLLPVRWQYFSQAMQSLGAATGIALLVMVFKNRWLKAAAAFALAGTTSFFLITSPGVNYDHAIYSSHTTVRYFLTVSEQQSLSTLDTLWDGQLAADATLEYPVVQELGRKIRFITDELDARNFSSLKPPGSTATPLIIIREEILEHPFFSYSGVMGINYDPGEVLQEQGFNRVYDSAGASAFAASP